MPNHYKLLEVPSFCNRNTIDMAYNQKVANLMGLANFSKEAVTLGTVKWEFTLSLLTDWLDKINSSNCEEFLKMFEQTHQTILFLCDEVKAPLCELRGKCQQGPLIDQFRRTTSSMYDEITLKLARLNRLNEAHSVLHSEHRSAMHNRYLMFTQIVNKITNLGPDLSMIVAGML